MKQLFLFIISISTVLAAFAQQSAGTTIIAVTGTRNLELSIDGKVYNLVNSSITNDKTTVVLDNLKAGQHSAVIRRTNSYSDQVEKVSPVFNLRKGYNMLVNVNANGSLELIETKAATTESRLPMSNTAFTVLLKNVKSQQSPNGRRSLIANSLNNTDNYFTAYQVVQLLQPVNLETYRLQLAKLSYRAVVDRNNFVRVNDVLRSEESKADLELYVRNYYVADDATVAMSEADFIILYRDLRTQWPGSIQVNSLINAFNDSTIFFTTNQVKQLLPIVTTENKILQLAKLSYRSVVDKVNFSQLYFLLNTQESRNDLAMYVYNYNQHAGNGIKTAMADDDFDDLYLSIQPQFFPNQKMNALTNAFNNPGYYFTTAQARQLTEQVSLESNRLVLAKLSYRTITDKGNFSQLYSMLKTQSSRDELDTYVKGYKEQ
jgi:hypothetical protein